MSCETVSRPCAAGLTPSPHSTRTCRVTHSLEDKLPVPGPRGIQRISNGVKPQHRDRLSKYVRLALTGESNTSPM